MERLLREKWSAHIVGKMHRLNISNNELAYRCGYTPSYLSTVLNCKKKFETPEAYDRTKARIYTTLALMEREIMEGQQ